MKGSTTLEDVTENEALLVAVPLGEVTESGPVIAPAGTVTTSWFAEAEVTVALIPLNVTEFCDGFVLNAVPEIATDMPADPLLGVKSRIDTWPADMRLTLIMLPTAS